MKHTEYATEQYKGFIHRLTTRRIAVRIIQEAPRSRQTEKQLGDAKETGRTGGKMTPKAAI